MVTAIIAVVGRSLRPAMFVLGVCVVTGAVTVVAKAAIGRPDPHGAIERFGGSFPSGHTITIILCLGLAVLLLPGVGWWIWLVPVAGGILMGASLLVEGTRWTTDIVGGALLAACVLAAASASGWVQ
jgi:membrane-associated phospholipid phosphatase